MHRARTMALPTLLDLEGRKLREIRMVSRFISVPVQKVTLYFSKFEFSIYALLYSMYHGIKDMSCQKLIMP
jgi:hypothetical protein